ncbi:MAG: multicopper oxidase domain-containing protein [Dehalococcoidales bacterium]|nr:multicopper oxidase domain-containing protein [Dehalococcoidales bacterium]
MKGLIRKLVIMPVSIIILSLVFSFVPVLNEPGAAQAAPWPARVVYNVYATDGWVTMADGVPMYIYGYIGGQAGVPLTYQDFGLNAMGGKTVTIPTGAPTPTAGPITTAELALAGKAQLPGPIIYARVGDIVEVHLKNLGTHMGTQATPNDPHTIHWHGVDQDAAMDGVPETSLAALPANLPGNPGAGNVIVYEFTSSFPGTYLYHCHQEASIHVHMGMYGALIFYNPRDAAAATGPGKGQGGTLFGHKYDSDYVMLLSEMDPNQNNTEYNPLAAPLVFAAVPFNVTMFFPTYWMINGLSFPNTIHAAMLTGGGAFLWQWWIDAHPGYDPFIQGSVNAKLGRGEKVLVRMINIGFEAEPMHVHGFHPKLIGMDQRAWTWSNPPGITAGQGLEMNTFSPASGQTMELLLDFGTVKPTANYSTQVYSRTNAAGAPVLNTDLTGLPMPDPFSGIVLPAGDYIAGPAVPTLFPWHNHDDYKSTNFGIYPGGQFTMVNVLP